MQECRVLCPALFLFAKRMNNKITSDNNKVGGFFMKRYSYQKNKTSRKEKIGFFTAFSVCLVAVGLALWSTYSSIGGFENSNVTEETTYVAYYDPTKQVDNQVTGITVDAEDETEAATEYTTEKITEATTEESPTIPYTGDSETLQTMLQVSATLDYPVNSSKITKPYSQDAVYSATLGDYRAHTGVDFEAEAGETVMCMCDGVVEDIYKDNMYGWVIKVVNGNFSVYYCGVNESVFCRVGDQVSRDTSIATVGEIPCESADPSHLHIEVKVGDKTIDPLLIISSEE